MNYAPARTAPRCPRITTALLAILLGVIACKHSGVPAPEGVPRPAPASEHRRWLAAHALPPTDYVLSKFLSYDIVFLGEWHRLRHDPLLVQALIPRLQVAGIHALGIEFACSEDQALADAVVTASEYDEAAVRRLLFHNMTVWGYQEYEDIYRAAWNVNRSRAPHSPPFRVLGLMYRARWDLLRPEDPDSARAKVWTQGDPDAHMATVILDAIRAGTQRLLVYSGSHHAFTKYLQPIYDSDTKHLVRLSDSRMGTLVARALPGRTFTIFLHSPWTDPEDALVRPAAGVIDDALEGSGLGPVGFDLFGTPVGAVAVPDTYYAIGHPGFTVSDFADGWIWQKPFSQYEGCTVDQQFITPENFSEAVAFISNPRARAQFQSPADLLDAMASDADMHKRLRRLR